MHLTAPFGQEYGPAGFTAPEAFTKAAFGLTPDEPLAGPIVGRDAIYVIALAKQLPSEIPPLDQIRDRVTRDYQLHEGHVARATQPEPILFRHFEPAMAGGKQFCVRLHCRRAAARNAAAVFLEHADLPELGDRAA